MVEPQQVVELGRECGIGFSYLLHGSISAQWS
jgi:hypothetical protein